MVGEFNVTLWNLKEKGQTAYTNWLSGNLPWIRRKKFKRFSQEVAWNTSADRIDDALMNTAPAMSNIHRTSVTVNTVDILY